MKELTTWLIDRIVERQFKIAEQRKKLKRKYDRLERIKTRLSKAGA